MAQIRFWQSKPNFKQRMANDFWFLRGIPALREAWNSSSPSITVHRQKALRAALTFCGLVLIGVLLGFIGARWGGWKT